MVRCTGVLLYCHVQPKQFKCPSCAKLNYPLPVTVQWILRESYAKQGVAVAKRARGGEESASVQSAGDCVVRGR